MSQFDYVKYDEQSQKIQASFKQLFEQLSAQVEESLSEMRPRYPKSFAKECARQHLEEAYGWIGKAIRDDQIERNGTAELQEERTNS